MNKTRVDRQSAELVVWPSPRSPIGLGGWLSGAGWLLASLAWLVRFHGLTLVLFGALDVLVVAVIVVYNGWARTRLALRLTPRGLFKSRLSGDRLVLERTEPARIVDLQVNFGGRLAPARTHVWLLVRANGTTAMYLEPEKWDERGLTALRERLSLDVEVIDELKTSKWVRKNYPRSLSWAVTHYIWSTIILIGLLSVLIAVLDGPHY